MLLLRSLAGLALALLAVVPAAAQAPESEFYKGKTVTILVGFGPGGGYDLYGRIIARFLPKYIPGNPTVVVQNMGAAGGLQAANHVYAAAPKDGNVIASVNASLLMYQLLGGSNARYDTAKLAWVGSGTNSNNSIITWHTSGIRTIEEAKRLPCRDERARRHEVQADPRLHRQQLARPRHGARRDRRPLRRQSQ